MKDELCFDELNTFLENPVCKNQLSYKYVIKCFVSNIILQGCRNSPLKSANFQKIDKLARLKSQKKETKKTMNVEPITCGAYKCLPGVTSNIFNYLALEYFGIYALIYSF